MTMEPTVDLLRQMHQGSHMAVQGYDEVIKDADDAALKRTLVELQNVHKEVALEASRRLQQNGAIPEEPHALSRLALWAQEGFRTLLDRSLENLLIILTDGARMGLDATEAALDRDFHADSDSLQFAAGYRDRQRAQLERLRELRRMLQH